VSGRPRRERPGDDVAERRITVPRSARYFVRGHAEPPRQLWLACHGYGQLAADFIADFAVLPPDVRVVAPEALNRYYLEEGNSPHTPDSPVGATWMTHVDRLAEIDDYVRFLDQVYVEAVATAGGAPVTALGFSQGVATVARWAARTRHRVDRIVLWAAGLPPELTPSADLFGSAAIVIAGGSRDRWFDPDRAGAGLRGARLDPRILRFDGGHRLDDDTLRDLAT
jgi:predicted esterase